ncbi:MAG: HAMP domain-containing protein, partial [Thermoplasmata archaeon]|nr:HAMP domain-containing protein [Thermoplasmata archaeon]
SLIAPSYITFVLSMVLLIIIVSYLDTVINKPLVRLAEAAERVSKGDFETEIEVTQPGDIGMLELNFKLISERVQRAMKELDMDD